MKLPKWIHDPELDEQLNRADEFLSIGEERLPIMRIVVYFSICLAIGFILGLIFL